MTRAGIAANRSGEVAADRQVQEQEERVAEHPLFAFQEGVGKIEVEERKLIWIWTHKLTHWLRMWVWSWWP